MSDEDPPSRPMPLADQQMSLLLEPGVGTLLVKVAGELDLGASTTLRDCLRSAVEDYAEVRLDLGDVTFMDSTGLKTILWGRRRADEIDRTLVIVRASTSVQRLLEVTGVDSFLGPEA